MVVEYFILTILRKNVIKIIKRNNVGMSNLRYDNLFISPECLKFSLLLKKKEQK